MNYKFKNLPFKFLYQYLVLGLLSSCYFNARITQSSTELVTSASSSSISFSKPGVAADGTTAIVVSVTLVTSSGLPVPGHVVRLTSSRGAIDTITAIDSFSDSSGVARFTVSSASWGSMNLTATDGTQALQLTSTPELRVGIVTQQAYVKATNNNVQAGSGTPQFGYSVALSANGSTMVVGDHNEKSCQTTITNGTTSASDTACGAAGSAFIFVRDANGNWAQQAYLKASNANVQGASYFGESVSISGDGNTVAIGAYGERSCQTTITNGSGSSTNVACAGAGAVFVYKRDASNSWSQQAYIKASNANVQGISRLGRSVSLSSNGNTLAVGATGEKSCQNSITNGTTSSTNVACSGAGAVFIYTRDSSNSWSQQAYIKASNASVQISGLGNSVSLSEDGNKLVVGASGDNSCQNTITNGSTSSTTVGCSGSGAAFVYTRDSSLNWSQVAYLKPSNAQVMSSAGYGYSVTFSADGSAIAVGDYNENSCQSTITNGTTSATDFACGAAGAVFVYRKSDGTNWAQTAYIKAANTLLQSGGIFFGGSVSLSSDGTELAVGAMNEKSCSDTTLNQATGSSNTACFSAGALYFYMTDLQGNWAQKVYSKPGNNNNGMFGSSYYGRSVALSSDGLTLAASNNEDSACVDGVTNGTTSSTDIACNQSGAVFVYKY